MSSTTSLGQLEVPVNRKRLAIPHFRLPTWAVSWLQVGPLMLILSVLFALPTVLFLVVSFFDYDRIGIYPAFILDNYHDLITTPSTWRVYLSSLKFAVIVWGITLFLGFNIAYFLVFHIRSNMLRTVLFLACAIPFWTSGIIRAIAWIPFLGRNGAFNQVLMALGVTSRPLEFLLFSDFAVIVTYVHLFTLLMIVNSSYMMTLFDSLPGKILMGVGVSWMCIGWAVMTKMIHFEI